MSVPAPPPDDLELPFFAYGLLKPPELGYHHVAALVATAETASTTHARLCIRDGLPLLLNEPHGSVHGALLTPTSGKEDVFYQAIREFEPARQYQGFSPVEVATRETGEQQTPCGRDGPTEAPSSSRDHRGPARTTRYWLRRWGSYAKTPSGCSATVGW